MNEAAIALCAGQRSSMIQQALCTW